MSGLGEVLATVTHEHRGVAGFDEVGAYFKYACECGWTGPDDQEPDLLAHIAEAQEIAILAWLGDLLGGDEMRERVARAIHDQVWGTGATETNDSWATEAAAALAAVRAMVGGGV